jgi:outer membrane protein insertion porin family
VNCKSVILFFLFNVSAVYSQPIVNNVDFSGNNFFSSLELSKSMTTKKDVVFNPTQFNADLISLRAKYKEAGFLLAKISNYKTKFSDDSTTVDISIQIFEGSRVSIGKIEITGNKEISTSQLISMFETKTGEVLDESKLNNDIKEVLNLYEKKGLPFTKAAIKEISIYYSGETPKILVSINISEGTKAQIDEIRIKGNEVTEPYVITREIGITEGQNINTEQLENIRRRLDNLAIFENVETPSIYEIKNTKKNGLLIEVKEGNNNTFDGVIGYVPPPTEDESGYFTGLVNINFKNIFGTGRRLDAKWMQETKATQELEFKYMEPFVLGFPVNINLGFLQRIQDSTYTKRKLEFKGDLKFTDNIFGSVILGLESIIPSSDSNVVFVTSDSRTLYAGSEIKYDSRDNIYNPLKGISIKFNYIYGNKTIFSGTGESFNIQKYSSELDFYFTFLKRQSTFIRLSAAEVNSDKLEDADLIRVGGMRNIRGYRDEQFLAERFIYENFEPRYIIGRRSFLFVFLDAGYYFREADALNNIPVQERFIYGYGFGLQIETGIGIIGVSYGLGKGDSFLDGKIHFGLINNF